MHPLTAAADQLRKTLHGLTFPDPVTHTYNPLQYAWQPHIHYLEKYGNGQKKVLFLGMNPGPYGMAQTGIPFGEIDHVTRWLGITGEVGKPENEHPKRPIQGFSCPRSEVSGRRLWSFFADTYGTADTFFQNHFVTNFCPLVWMKDTGANLTPDKLTRDAIAPVEKACRTHLRKIIETLTPTHLIGVGGFAEKQFQQITADMEQDFHIGRILHPSPASPAANRDFAGTAKKQLQDLGLL